PSVVSWPPTWSLRPPACWAAPGPWRPSPLPRRRPADNRIVVSLPWPRSGFAVLLAVGLSWLTALPAAAGSTSVLAGPLEIRIIGANGLRDFIAQSPEDRRGAATLLKQVAGAMEGPTQPIEEAAAVLPHYWVVVRRQLPS